MAPEHPSAGLCRTCRYGRVVVSRRAGFMLCERSFVEARYPRYPRLPVLMCDAYVRGPSGGERPGEPVR